MSVIYPWRCRNVNSPLARIRIQVAELTAVNSLPTELEAPVNIYTKRFLVRKIIIRRDGNVRTPRITTAISTVEELRRSLPYSQCARETRVTILNKSPMVAKSKTRLRSYDKSIPPETPDVIVGIFHSLVVEMVSIAWRRKPHLPFFAARVTSLYIAGSLLPSSVRHQGVHGGTKEFKRLKEVLKKALG
ncbi:Uncharacterized protein Rs2_21769 [Raphanus sativus]|nr:Uncharacterized protein Rs2_21769 [Raphanus sativus]